MNYYKRSWSLICRTIGRRSAVAIAFLFGLMLFALSAQAQYIIHHFTGGADGKYPVGDSLEWTGYFATTSAGGARSADCPSTGCGTVFGPGVYGYGFATIHQFIGGADGAVPMSGVVSRAESVYGATWYGGGGACQGGCGVVYRLTPFPWWELPLPNNLGRWTENVLYRFSGGSDGCHPDGKLVFDSEGSMYGVSEGCGAHGGGTVFKLTPSGSGYALSVLYTFAAGANGLVRWGGLVFDRMGNLYGTTCCDGQGGTVYELTPPPPNTETEWIKTSLHMFTGSPDGAIPLGGVIFDDSGTLFGTTFAGGEYSGGTVFQLTPSTHGWTESILHAFSGSDGWQPKGGLGLGLSGLYGTTVAGGSYNGGTLFRVSSRNGVWNYAVLHHFGGEGDGAHPLGTPHTYPDNDSVVGTASTGGAYGGGLVWEGW